MLVCAWHSCGIAIASRSKNKDEAKKKQFHETFVKNNNKTKIREGAKLLTLRQMLVQLLRKSCEFLFQEEDVSLLRQIVGHGATRGSEEASDEIR